jgi:formate dehydrogenase beta subunit
MNDIVIPVSKIRRPRSTPKGRSVDPVARAEVAQLVEGVPVEREYLIENLHRVQDRFGHLSAAHLAALAEAMKLSMAEVYEVATFYHHFDVVKEGEAAPPAVTVRVCETLSCRMAGAQQLLDKLPGLVGPNVRVLAAPCIGRCAEAPAVCVGHNAFGHATESQITKVLKEDKLRAPALHPHTFAHYGAQGGYKTWVECVSGKRDVESVLKTMEDAGLRGLGGAGFPTGRKWRIVRAEPGPRLMAVNIDEGEPGTFKDRHYLERDPHRFIEGMLIAAWAVGIEDIYVYLRDEYHACREMLERELAALRANPPAVAEGRAGDKMTLPRIHLRRGAGAYICGEESAMIESIEGRRGMPRLRPPYVAQVGLFGRPTLEHNMETLLWVRDIIEHGAEWFSKNGRNGRKGLRSFSVSGRVKKPGVHLAHAGITVKELIEEHCGGMADGHQLYAYLPGGASGGILPASMGDIPLDFDTLQPHGVFIGSAAVIILSQHDRARDAALNLMQFFEHESCGQCTPCRVGTAKAAHLMEAPKWDKGLLEELSVAMADASICGLGQAAPNPIRCVVKHFPNEI